MDQRTYQAKYNLRRNYRDIRQKRSREKEKTESDGICRIGKIDEENLYLN